MYDLFIIDVLIKFNHQAFQPRTVKYRAQSVIHSALERQEREAWCSYNMSPSVVIVVQLFQFEITEKHVTRIFA